MNQAVVNRWVVNRCFVTRILVLALLGTACGDTDDAAPDGSLSVVRDSAGIAIVENRRPALDSRLPWRFGTQLSLSIGAVDSGEPDQLFRVTDATRLADGRIVIANSGSNELRVFNMDGSHAATWGGRGEGPGEFVSYSPTAVAHWPGDSIAAPNPWGTRLSLFDRDGNHGRDVALDASLLNVVDLLPDGEIFTSGSGGLRGDMTGSSGLVRRGRGMGNPGRGRHAACFTWRVSRNRVLRDLRGGRKHRGREAPPLWPRHHGSRMGRTRRDRRAGQLRDQGIRH